MHLKYLSNALYNSRILQHTKRLKYSQTPYKKSGPIKLVFLNLIVLLTKINSRYIFNRNIQYNDVGCPQTNKR